jgi:N6-L-threonylcarbamoyladenine synthase
LKKLQRQGDEGRFDLPRPLLDREGCDFSFSGLKTALMRTQNEITKKQGGLFKKDVCDLSASFSASNA